MPQIKSNNTNTLGTYFSSMYVYIYVCMYVCVYICMYVCMYVCRYLCVCVLVYIHIRMRWLIFILIFYFGKSAVCADILRQFCKLQIVPWQITILLERTNFSLLGNPIVEIQGSLKPLLKRGSVIGFCLEWILPFIVPLNQSLWELYPIHIRL